MGANVAGYGTLVLSVLCIGLVALMATRQAIAMQMTEQSDPLRASAAVALVENPELTVRVLENLLRSILYSTATADLQPITK